MQTATQQEEVTRLREQVESLKKMLGERDAQIERQRIQIENLTRAVLHARKKMYGPFSVVSFQKYGFPKGYNLPVRPPRLQDS